MTTDSTNEAGGALAGALNAAALAGLVSCLACAEPKPAPSPSPPSSAATAPAAPAAAPPAAAAPSSAEVAGRLHLGLDVSGHSGTVDWATLAAAGHTFAFVKATEGEDLKDPAFDEHWPAIREAGITRGAYHFYVTEDDPADQARFFIETVALEPGDLAPVVDVETLGHGTQPGLPDRLKSFLAALEAHYGVKPILYTSVNFWDANLTGEFGEYPLWVAEYGVSEPRLPNGWSAWHLWQWQEDAQVPGVQNSADLSHVNRSGPDLSALIVPP